MEENGGDLGAGGHGQPQHGQGQPLDQGALQADFNQRLLDAILSLQVTHNQNLQNQSLQNQNQSQNQNQTISSSAKVVREDN